MNRRRRRATGARTGTAQISGQCRRGGPGPFDHKLVTRHCHMTPTRNPKAIPAEWPQNFIPAGKTSYSPGLSRHTTKVRNYLSTCQHHNGPKPSLHWQWRAGPTRQGAWAQGAWADSIAEQRFMCLCCFRMCEHSV